MSRLVQAWLLASAATFAWIGIYLLALPHEAAAGLDDWRNPSAPRTEKVSAQWYDFDRVLHGARGPAKPLRRQW